MPVLKLTQEQISQGKLLCPEGKTRIEYCDNVVSGLYLEIRATNQNQGTYYLRYKSAGKTSHQKLGRTTDMSLAEARAAAKKLKAEIQLGADPRGEARAKREAITLEDLVRDHYIPYIKPRKRSWRRDEELFRLRILPKFGAHRLAGISRQAVQTFHAALLEEGLSHASADHHLKVLRRALNLAVEWEMLEKNPIKGVQLFHKDNKVEHYMDEAKLEALLVVLRTHPNRTVCLIAMFLLSTGCRLNEALRARWSEVDRRARVWRIPATNSKSQRTRSVPLNDAALQVLAQIDTEGKFDFLFVNRQTRKPYTTIMKVWSRLRAQAGLPHLRIHDLRHQFASFLVNNGRTLFEVQQILGHSDPSVTQRYAHLSSSALQAAANSASKHLM